MLPSPTASTCTVERRGPQASPGGALLRRLVRDQLPRLLDAAEAQGRTVPGFVRRELEAIARCGSFAGGFADLHCAACDHHRLVPFTCGGRGFCPSCGGRRLAERARHLVEWVLPAGVPIRQVVLTLPWRLRLLLARRHDLCRGVLKVFLRAVFGWTRRRARQALGLRGARCGAITVIQRFGGALNLDVHFHSLLPDGVFVRDGERGRVRFAKVPTPTTEEVERLVETVAARLTRWLARRGFGEGEHPVEDDPGDAGLLLQAASAAGRAALGKRAGRRAQRIRTVAGRGVRLPPRCAALDGYNVHAGVVVGGHDEEAVERLCLYVCRPALAKSRIEAAPGGGVVLRFKRPWSDRRLRRRRRRASGTLAGSRPGPSGRLAARVCG